MRLCQTEDVAVLRRGAALAPPHTALEALGSKRRERLSPFRCQGAGAAPVPRPKPQSGAGDGWAGGVPGSTGGSPTLVMLAQLFLTSSHPAEAGG